MVEIRAEYLGDLHCRAVHGPSGESLLTDAPVDNQGKGEYFSPTDLVGTAMGTCMLTILAIIARRHEVDITGATAVVQKEMASSGVRRIARLPVVITVPVQPDDEQRVKFENAVRACPVHHSLHPDIDAPITFVWGAAA